MAVVLVKAKKFLSGLLYSFPGISKDVLGAVNLAPHFG